MGGTVELRTEWIKEPKAFWDFRTQLANALLDIRFGRLLRGMETTRYAHVGAYSTANSTYAEIDRLFQDRVKSWDVLVDVGCGKGRVINAWLHKGYRNRMIGVELDAEIAADTRRRLYRFPNVSIISGDIVTNFPDAGTLFYLYNPFDAHVMGRFKDRLKDSLSHRSRAEATVIYNNCCHMEVFAEDETCEIERGQLQHPFAIIRLTIRRAHCFFGCSQ